MKNDHQNSRRKFIIQTGKAGIATGLSLSALNSFARNTNSLFGKNDEPINYQQAGLGYNYNALEPVIDAMTMEIHYTKHAAGYTKNLADAVVAENVDTKKTKLHELLGNISKYSVKMRNNAGGHFNHELYWKTMSPGGTNAPSDKLLKVINKSFGSFDAFKTQFADAAKNRFGSGWAWLTMIDDDKFVISSTPNQDNPYMDVAEIKGTPLLGIDVWEHAYYLKYQNRRPDYITAWLGIVNWDYVEKRFKQLD
jgi:Fe-Mn family superoxide dismutase